MKTKIIILICLCVKLTFANEISVLISQNNTKYIDFDLATQQYAQNTIDTSWLYYIKSITISSQNEVFCHLSNSAIYSVDSNTGALTKIATQSGLNTIEVADDGIYGMTDSALYKINSGNVSQVCSLSGYSDIAVSPQGKIVALKTTNSISGGDDYPGYQTDTNLGLFEIDPLSGAETRLSSFINCSGQIVGSETVSLYPDNDIETTLTDIAGVNMDICFSNDGLLWLKDDFGKLLSIDINDTQTITGKEYFDPISPWSYIVSTFDYYSATSYDLPNSILGNSFDVYVTPEPLSLLTFGLGSLIINRRKKY